MKNKVATAIFSTIYCASLGVSSAFAGDLTIIPAISVAEVYIDDVNLNSNFAQSDFVTETTVGGLVTNVGPRLNLDVNYGLTHLYYPELQGDKDEFRHNLKASGNSELVRDYLFIDMNAGINQRFVDPRATFSRLNVTRSANRTTVGIYDVSPYFVKKLGGNFSTLTTRYRVSHVNTSGNTPLNTVSLTDTWSTNHEISAIINSGTKFSRLSWDITNSYRKRVSSNRRDNKMYNSIIGGGYSLNRKISAVGSVGYTKRNAQSGTSNFSGIVWNAGVILTPGPRTSLELRIGESYFGRTYIVNGRYIITPQLNFTINYNDRLNTYQTLILDSFLAGQNNAAAVQQGYIDNVFVRRKLWTARLTGTRGRSTIALTARNANLSSEIATRNQNRNTFGVTWTRRMTTNMSINASAYYIEIDFKSDRQKDKYISYSAGMDYNISRSLIGTVEYIHTLREQLLFNYIPRKSNLVRVSIGATF